MSNPEPSPVEAIEDALPNGFHDALLVGVNIVYAERTAALHLHVEVSGPDSKIDPVYRRGVLRFGELAFVIIDPPEGGLDCQRGDLRIDAGPGEPGTALSSLPELPAGAFLHWFFVTPWNSFIRVAAGSATFEWAD